MNICNIVEDLITYAEETGLIDAADRVYAINRVLEVLKLSDFAPEAHVRETELEAILGHMFPCFYRFKGGKGVATTAVVVLCTNPFLFAILLLAFIIIVAGSKMISLGSVMCMLLYPVVLDRVERSRLFHENPPPASPFALFACLIMVLVVVKHWENIKRLLKGTESKFSFKKSVKKTDENVSSEEPQQKS